VSPKDKFTDRVLDPVPDRFPLNRKLPSANRPFDIAKQDEKAFPRTARALPEDIPHDQGFGAELPARRYDLWYLEVNGYLGRTLPPIKDFTRQATDLRAVEDAKAKEK
jgi:hypothetical protein